jgi:hypothetical protein
VTVGILLLFTLVLLMARVDVCSSWELTMALVLACAFPNAGLTSSDNASNLKQLQGPVEGMQEHTMLEILSGMSFAVT